MRAKTVNFERGLNPKDAMNVGDLAVRFAHEMCELENELKRDHYRVWQAWTSKTDDIWRDGDINHDEEKLSDFEVWKKKYENDPKEALFFQKQLLNWKNI